MKRTADKSIFAGITLAIISLIAIVFISVQQSQKLRDTSQLVSHNNEVLMQAQRILYLSEQNEHVAHEIIISGLTDTAGNFRISTANLVHEIIALKELTADNPKQQDRVDSLLMIHNKRYEFLLNLVNQKNGAATLNLSQRINSPAVRSATTEMQSLLIQVQQEENRLLADRKTQNEDTSAFIGNILFLLVLLIIFLLCYIIYTLRIEMRRRDSEVETLQYNNSLVNNIADAVISTTFRGDFEDRSNLVIRSWNKGAEKLYGYAATETIGKELNMLHSQVSPEQREFIIREITGMGAWSGELIQRKKSGERLYVRSSVTVIKGKRGIPSGLVIVNHNITPEKEAEEKLKQFSQDLEKEVKRKTAELTGIFERVTNAVMALDRNWNVTYLNSRAEALLGIPSAQLLGRNIWSPDRPATNPELQQALVQSMQEQRYITLQNYSGSLQKWLEIHLYPSPEGMSVFFNDITEQKIAQDKFQQQQADLEAVVENTRDIVFSIDREMHLLTFNSSFTSYVRATTGKSPARGALADTLFTGEQLHLFMQMAARGSSGERFSYEEELLVNGDKVYTEVSVNPMLDKNGKQIGMSFFSRNISKRRLTEISLAGSEEKYKTIFYKSPLPKWIFDSETLEFLEVNDAAVEHYGYSQEEFLKMKIGDIRPEEDLERMHREISSLDENTDINRGYWRHKKKNGQLISVEVTAHPMEYNGRKARMVVVSDITDKLRAEEKLETERNLLRVLIDNLPDFIYVKDLELKHIINNRANIELIGAQSEQETLGKTSRELFGDKLSSAAADSDNLVIRCGESVINKEEPMKGPQGEERWLLTTKVPLRDKQNQITGIVGISRDITERKKTLLKLAGLNDDLQHRAAELASSNADLERFAYIASHDLQEPLRMVSSFLQLLKKKYAGQLDEKADQYIHFAVDGAERMKVLIKDLLEYSRVGVGQSGFEKVDLNLVCEEVKEIFSVTLGTMHGTLRIGPLPCILGSKTQMLQLFQNLVSNAVKYHADRALQISISAEEQPTRWIFSVADNGIGIDPAFFDKIFIVFQRLHNRTEYPGTGIGLAICKKIAERHGGQIWVESGKETGSIFYFSISKNPG